MFDMKLRKIGTQGLLFAASLPENDCATYSET